MDEHMPELIDACKAALGRLLTLRTVGRASGGEGVDPNYLLGNEDVIRRLEAAIAKAEGRS